MPVGADDAAAADRGTATVILDMAHNEAGLEALLEVAHGLKAPGGRVHVGIGATGDRPDEAIEGLGEIAGKSRRPGRHRAQAEVPAGPDDRGHRRAPAGRAGPGRHRRRRDVRRRARRASRRCSRRPDPATSSPTWRTPSRSECADRLLELGGSPDDPRTIRRKVVEARGGHELDAEIAELWSLDDADERVARFRVLVGDRPRDLRLAYELAAALGEAGQDAESVERHVQAVARGLREPFRHRAQLRAAAGLRTLGRLDEALDLLDEVSTTHPGSVAAAALRGLVLADAGREREAVADLLDALLDHAADEDATSYRAAVRAQAEALREG